MMRVIVLGILGLIVTVPAEAAKDARRAVPLKLAAFEKSFRSCDGLRLKGITRYWELTQEEVDKIDEALVLHSRTALKRKLGAPLSWYRRQYLGFQRGDHRFVYVNSLPAPYFSETQARTKFQRACGGGSMFWRIEYDFESGEFRNFQTNAGR